MKLRILLLSGSAVLLAACTETDSEPSGGSTTQSSSSGGETSGAAESSGGSSSGETGAVASSSTTDEGSSSGEPETGSSSGGLEADCSMCNADAEPDPLCHSSFNPETGACECDAGYTFETDALDDFTCVLDPNSGAGGDDPNVTVNEDGDCACAEGWEWCSTDPADLSCCEAG